MANIRVDTQIWASLGSQRQAQVSAALRRAGIVQEGESIAPRHAVPGASPSGPHDACVDGCFDAYDAATFQCGDIPVPERSQACFDAANAALSACLRRCP